MSAPTPEYGAPSLGPIDRIPNPPRPEYGLGWDDITPSAWRALSEPADTNPDTRKENTPMGDHSINGGYGHQPLPAPPAPAPQQPAGQK